MTAGIRPEHVVIGAVADSRLRMDVLLVEPLGATALVTLGRIGQQLLAVTDGRSAPRERQAVEVGLDMRQIHLFERSSGQALRHGAADG